MANPTIVFTGKDRASEVIRNIARSVDKLGGSFGALQRFAGSFNFLTTALKGFAGGFVFTEIVNGIRSVITGLDDRDEAAQGLGVTAVQLGGMRQAGHLSDSVIP